MASKAKSPRVKRTKFENDLEKLRCENCIEKAFNILQTNTEKIERPSITVDLIRIEQYLENASTEPEYNPQAINEYLAEVLKCLDRISKPTTMENKIDIQILTAKYHFMKGDSARALVILESLKLLEYPLPKHLSHTTYLLAEGNALQGLCLEENLVNTKTTGRNRTDIQSLVIRYFEMAGDICVLHFQELANLETLSGQAMYIPKMVETAIQRSPILHVQNGDLQKAVTRLRKLLHYIEVPPTQPLRQTLSRQLAEVLLRGISAGNYKKCDINALISEKCQVVPATYSSKAYIPDDHIQEAVLMLLISEHIANRSAVLNRNAEYQDAKIQTLHNSSAVYDLLVIALVRKGCFNFLSKTLENSLKFSYKEFHIWFQFALSLLSAAKYERAHLVLQECLRLRPDDIACYMHIISLCYDRLGLVDQGLQWSLKLLRICNGQSDDTNNYDGASESDRESDYVVSASKSDDDRENESDKAKETDKERNKGKSSHKKLGNSTDQKNANCSSLSCSAVNKAHIMRGRAHLFCGWGYSLQSYLQCIRLSKTELQSKAIHYYEESCKIDPNDPLARYHLALEFACRRDLDAALDSVLVALQLNQAHWPSMLLLILIHSAMGNTEDSFSVACAAVQSYPSNLHLRLIKAKLISLLYGAEKSFNEFKEMLQIWRDSYGPKFDVRGFTEKLNTLSSANSISQQQTDIDNQYPVLSPGVKWSKLGRKWSGRSNFSSYHGVNVVNPIVLLVRILLSLAEQYLELSKEDEAMACILEATSTNQITADLIYTDGLYQASLGRMRPAKLSFENAIELCPCHVNAMLKLAKIYELENEFDLAENCLRQALTVDATSYLAWQYLGDVQEKLDLMESAHECYVVASELERTEPIQPFFILPRGLNCNSMMN